MQIVKSCTYTHPGIGPIHVRVNANARSIRARWVGPEVHITIPQGLPVDSYDRFIDDFGARIISAKPRSRFYPGQIIDGNYVDFEIRLSATAAVPGTYLSELNGDDAVRGKHRNYIINIATSHDGLCPDFSSPRIETALNKLLIATATKATADYIVPRARKLAAQIDRYPLGWDIKDSRTRLGCCSSNGIITLSPRLIFLPLDLADYIIYHELAHLSEMNHSASVHQLCDAYCNGREAEYQSRVRAFKFPVF